MIEKRKKETKKCSKCRKELIITEFYKNSASKDGLQQYCKKCHKEKTKTTREKYITNNKQKENFKLKEKLCPKCNTIHDIKNFSKNNGTQTGLESWCKQCKKQYVSENLDNTKLTAQKRRMDIKTMNIKTSVAPDPNQKKICGHCNVEKTLNHFTKSPSVLGGYSYTCKECRKKYYTNNKESIINKSKEWTKQHKEQRKEYLKNYSTLKTSVYYNIKRNAEKRKIFFNLSEEDVNKLLFSNDSICCYCGITQQENMERYFLIKNIKEENTVLSGLKRGTNSQRLTIDRTNSQLGYTLDNVVSCCCICNVTKSVFITGEAMKIIGPIIKEDIKNLLNTSQIKEE